MAKEKVPQILIEAKSGKTLKIHYPGIAPVRSTVPDMGLLSSQESPCIHLPLLPQAPPELKVFVDLASISAGRMTLMWTGWLASTDAVQGYAPLLYELDTSAGFDEFMQHLKSCGRL